MTFEQAVMQDYRAIMFMLARSYRCIERAGRDARARNHNDTVTNARSALTALLEATLQTLNSNVDSAIAAVESVTATSTPTVSTTRAQRSDRVAALEQRFRFSAKEPQGWNAVAKTNDETNALQHRLGLSWGPGVTTPLALLDSVDPTETELLARLDDVQSWLLALGFAAGLIHSAA